MPPSHTTTTTTPLAPFALHSLSVAVQVNRQQEEACVLWPVPRYSRQSKEGARRGGRASVNRRSQSQSPTHPCLSYTYPSSRLVAKHHQEEREREREEGPGVVVCLCITVGEDVDAGADRPRRPTTPPPVQLPDGVPTPNGQHRRRDDSMIPMCFCFDDDDDVDVVYGH